MRIVAWSLVAVLSLSIATHMSAQSLGNAGTIEGAVTDPSGGAVAKAQITLHNPVTGYSQSVESGRDGNFRLGNIPPNPYHLEVKAAGFNTFAQNLDVRNAIPVQIKAGWPV